MPKNISNIDSSASDGVFGQILVNNFAAQINSNAAGFIVYNSVSTSPLFKINGSGASPSATFYCDLNVIGSASFTAVSNIAVSASMLSLATGNSSSDLIDIGFYGLYNNSGNKYRGLVKSVSLDRWVLFKEISTAPSSTVILSGSWRDSLEVQDLYFNGDGSTLSALKASVVNLPSELNNLTNTEILQLENIGSNTISNTQWSYLANSDQRTDTAGTPSFSGLTLSTGTATLPAGSVTVPTLNFGDTSTGLYRVGANQLGFTSNGTLKALVSTAGLSMSSGVFNASAGAVGTPSLHFSDATTGIYKSGSNQIGISISGTNTVDISSSGVVLSTGTMNVPNGSFGAPGLSFAYNTAVGIYCSSGSIILSNANDILAIFAHSSTDLGRNGSPVFVPKIATTGNGYTNIDYLASFTALMTVDANSTTCNAVQTGMRFNLSAGTTGYKQRQYYAQFDSVTIGSSATMTEMIGFYSDTFTNVTRTGTLTTACSAYFKTQTVANTNNCAVFTEDLVVGSAIGTPPANGAMIAGNTLIGATSNPDSRKLLVNGSIESSTGGIYGTLQTTAQPNILSIGSTGIMLYNPGKMTVGSSTSSNAILTVDNDTTLFIGNSTYASIRTKGTINLFTAAVAGSILAGLYLNETLTSSSAFDFDEYHSMYIATTLSPAGGANNLLRGITIAPTIGTAGSSTEFIGVNVVPNFSNGANLTILVGMSTTDFIGAASTVTSVIGGYFPHPQVSSTTTRMGLFAGSLSVGTTTGVMASGELQVAGRSTLATVRLSVGSVGSPSVYFSTETATGFYRAGSNQIGISINGTNMCTISGSGMALNSLAISGVSTLTATTLTGTLSTGSQPNITTLASVSSIGTSGNVAISSTLSVGTGSPVAGATLYLTSTSHCSLWVNAPTVNLANRIWGKAGVAVWQNYVPGSSTDLRWYTSSDIMVLSAAGNLNTSSFQAGSGSASVPAFGFTSQTNTGLFYSANTFNITTQGTTRVIVSSAGLTVANAGIFITDSGTSVGGVVHHAFRSTGSVLRWGLGLQNTETSGNVGSDFKIFSYADNGTALADSFQITRSNNRMQSFGSTVIGTSSALATNATSGFLYIPSCAGAPVGTPGAETGKVALVYDSTNNRLFIYNGSWRSVATA